MLTFGLMNTISHSLTGLISVLLLAACMAACGHNESFRVKGTVTDGSSINLRFVYYTDNAVRTGLTASTEGKFEFEGSALQPAAVEVYDNEYRLLGRFVATNGEDIELNIDRKNMYLNQVSGNDLNRQLTEFYNANSDELAKPDSPERNKIIADYAKANSDNPLARLLIVTEFDASTDDVIRFCDSLLRAMPTDVISFDLADSFMALNSRVASDSSHNPIAAITYKKAGNRVATFVPQRSRFSVISISDGAHGRDSVVSALRKLAAHEKKGQFALIDLCVDADTLTWTRTIRNDSATWTQGWAAGSISGQSLGRLGVPALPYFILADSAGRQIWRGGSVSEIVMRTETALNDK